MPALASLDARAVSERPTAPPLPAPPPLEPVPDEPQPKRDSQVQRAGLVAGGLIETQAQEPVGGQEKPAVPPAAPAVSQPPAGGDRPVIDLPPIEGAQDVEVPNLRNNEDVPRVQPLPGATEDQPAPPVRADQKEPKKKPA